MREDLNKVVILQHVSVEMQRRKPDSVRGYLVILLKLPDEPVVLTDYLQVLSDL